MTRLTLPIEPVRFLVGVIQHDTTPGSTYQVRLTDTQTQESITLPLEFDANGEAHFVGDTQPVAKTALARTVRVELVETPADQEADTVTYDLGTVEMIDGWRVAAGLDDETFRRVANAAATQMGFNAQQKAAVTNMLRLAGMLAHKERLSALGEQGAKIKATLEEQ